MANGPSPGDWVTLDFLHLSGKAHEKGHCLLPLEIPQGHGTLRTCQASQMEGLQQQGNKWSAPKYIYANQRHLVLRQQSAAQATSEQGKGGQGRKGCQGLPLLAHLLGGETGPASPQANVAPPCPKPPVFRALRKRKSSGLAPSLLVSRKGLES